MFDDCDEIWRVGRGYGGTFTLLRGKFNYEEEARNKGVKWVSILGQIKKKMFSDFIHFWRVGRGYGGTFTLLRGKFNYEEEARNMDLNGFSFS